MTFYVSESKRLKGTILSSGNAALPQLSFGGLCCRCCGECIRRTCSDCCSRVRSRASRPLYVPCCVVFFLFKHGRQAQNHAVITRLRHRQSLVDAHDALHAGLQHDFHQAPELAAEDFRQAAVALGRITGDVDVEELLGQIFSSFCIGK